jgi:stress response protein YsnF
MATKTITALFESRAAAENARARLTAVVPTAQARVIEQDGMAATGMAPSSQQHQGLWAQIKDLFLPDEDRAIYAESIRRGDYLLCAQVPETAVDEAIDTLEAAGPLDVDARQEQWRSEGWQGPVAATSATGGDVVEEQKIPVVEEQRRVGKREVARGAVRVRAYAVEEPVHEDVRLREERVEIERRPVNEVLSTKRSTAAADDLLTERTIEMRETAEEAVVEKQARVKEELVVRKHADERVERIDDSVRHTEIDVSDADPKAPVEPRSTQKDLGANRPRR